MAAALMRDARRMWRHWRDKCGRRPASRLPRGFGILRANGRVKSPDDSSGRIARLLANLSFIPPHSVTPVRLALCVGLGDAIGRGLHLERAYWLPMTIAMC